MAVLALVSARPALAQPTVADRENARSLWQDGIAKRSQNDHPGALKSFEAADALMGLPVTGVEVAREREALGLLIEARDIALRTAKRTASTPEDERAKADALGLYEALGPRIPAIELSITGVQPDSNVAVRIDGVEVPGAAVNVPRRVNPGTHVIKVDAVGYGTVERKVEVAEGAAARVEIHLQPSAPASPPGRPAKMPARPDPQTPEAGLPSAAGIVRLHIETDEPTIQLYRRYDVTELPFLAGAGRSTLTVRVCGTPCDRVIDGREGRFYFGGEEGIPSSVRLDFSGLQGKVRADVRAGSTLRNGGGVALIVLSVIGIGASVGYIGVAAGSEDPRGDAIAGAGVGIGVASGLLALGTYLVLTSDTRFELSSQDPGYRWEQ